MDEGLRLLYMQSYDPTRQLKSHSWSNEKYDINVLRTDNDGDSIESLAVIKDGLINHTVRNLNNDTYESEFAIQRVHSNDDTNKTDDVNLLCCNDPVFKLHDNAQNVYSIDDEIVIVTSDDGSLLCVLFIE